MCDGVFITLGNGNTVCFPILKNQRAIEWPPHGPGDPWQETLDDIATIAMISQGVTHVRNEGARGQLRQAVLAAYKAAAQKLPAGVAIGDGLMKAAEGR